jgi:hypothetical protein
MLLYFNDYIYRCFLIFNLRVIRKFDLLKIFKFCEEYRLLRCDVKLSVRSTLTFEKDLLPPSSGQNVTI